VRLAKPHQTVDLIVPDVETESVNHPVESLSLIAKKIVELVGITSVISRPRILVSVQKIVDIVVMAFAMLIKERIKFLVRQIVVSVFAGMVVVLLENQHKHVQLIVSLRTPILALFRLHSILQD